MRSKAISLCALLLTSMVLVISAPVESEEEFPELPPRPFTELPDIESYGVWPETGWNDTTFSFHLNATLDYFWNETIPRLNETVQVYIDYVAYDMQENNTRDTNWTDGKHFYWMNEERLWSKGLIPYFFYIEVNESSNTTETNYFEILNRAPYILSPPPMLIYVDEVVNYTIRVQDDDLDPIDGDLIDHNFNPGDWWFIYWYEDNLTFYGKPKKEFVRWLNITIWDSYNQLAWYRWTITCVENPGGGDPGGDSHFTRGAGDSQTTPKDGPLHNTDYYWCGSACGGNGYKWDDENNWREGAGWTISGYPVDSDDRAYLNETADDLYLLDGANSVITLGELHTASGFSGTITFSIDLILDRSLGKSGDLDHAAGTIDVNTSNEQINLDGNPTISATFNEQEGIVIVQGAQTQEIRVQSPNKLYKLTTDTATTFAELYDNLTVYKILIGAGTTYRMDANSRGYELWTNFSDIAGCGFVSTSSGTLNLIGASSGRGANITTADVSPPPTNYWAGYPTDATSGSIILHNTTVSYGREMGLGWTILNTISNLTVSYFNGGGYALYIRTPTAASSYNDITISDYSAGSLRCLLVVMGAVTGRSYVISNFVISSSSCGSNEVHIAYGKSGDVLEFLDSNFDETKVGTTTAFPDAWISKTHDDVANAYKMGCQDGYSFDKSSITNDYDSLSDIQLISGTFTIDIASASNDFTIDSGATLVLNATQTHTFDADANLTNSGILKSDGDITTSSGYFDFYNTGSIWLNNSTVSNADLNYYLGGFNFSVGKAANSTIDDWNLVADSGADASFNITYYDFNNKVSGVIWHMNATASASENIRFHTKNLTSGEYYWLYVDNSFHEYEIADANGWANYSYDSWSTKYIYLTWASGAQIGGRPGGGVITGIGATFQYIIISDDTVEFRATVLGFSEGRDMTVTYYWVFSDNTTSNEKNPTKSFEYAGITANASATLVVCNEKVCSQPIEKSVHLIRWWIIVLILAAIITPVILGAWRIDKKYR